MKFPDSCNCLLICYLAEKKGPRAEVCDRFFPRSSGDYSVGWSDAEARALADFDRALEAREEGVLRHLEPGQPVVARAHRGRHGLEQPVREDRGGGMRLHGLLGRLDITVKSEEVGPLHIVTWGQLPYTLYEKNIRPPGLHGASMSP